MRLICGNLYALAKVSKRARFRDGDIVLIGKEALASYE